MVGSGQRRLADAIAERIDPDGWSRASASTRNIPAWAVSPELNKNHRICPFRAPDESDRVPIRRPFWPGVVGGVRGQAQRGSRTAGDLEVNIPVVFFLAVPRKCHLVAVGSEIRIPFIALVAGQGIRPRGTGAFHRPALEIEACQCGQHTNQRQQSGPQQAWRQRPAGQDGREFAGVGFFLQLVESSLQIRHGLYSARGIFAQAAPDQPLEFRRRSVAELADRLRLIAQDAQNCREGGIRLEGPLTGGHFVHHRSEGKNVRAVVHILSFRLFGRHIGRCP